MSMKKKLTRKDSKAIMDVMGYNELQMTIVNENNDKLSHMLDTIHDNMHRVDVPASSFNPTKKKVRDLSGTVLRTPQDVSRARIESIEILLHRDDTYQDNALDLAKLKVKKLDTPLTKKNLDFLSLLTEEAKNVVLEAEHFVGSRREQAELQARFVGSRIEQLAVAEQVHQEKIARRKRLEDEADTLRSLQSAGLTFDRQIYLDTSLLGPYLFNQRDIGYEAIKKINADENKLAELTAVGLGLDPSAGAWLTEARRVNRAEAKKKKRKKSRRK